jgi:hypothetical protein
MLCLTHLLVDLRATQNYASNSGWPSERRTAHANTGEIYETLNISMNT